MGDTVPERSPAVAKIPTRAMHDKAAQFRFFAELNDFIPQDRKHGEFNYRFIGSPSIKDSVEAIGVPHPEIDLILVNNVSVGFDYHLQPGDRVGVYPVFESMDVSPIVRLRPKPLRKTAFLLAGHLGKLARLLRMLGFDSSCRKARDDSETIWTALKERRIILTRNRQLLKAREVTHGYWIRSQDPEKQVREVLTRFDLFSQVEPFRRCMVCNGVIRNVDKEIILHKLPDRTRAFYNDFGQCADCDAVYWKGSHFERMQDTIRRLVDRGQSG